MKNQRTWIRLKASMAVAILAVTLLVTSAQAAVKEKVLYDFHSYSTDGANPYAGLIFDASGNLYGTATDGGTDGGGVVFELLSAEGGQWTESILHNFTGGTDGYNPYGGLVFDAFGNLYGTTNSGGQFDLGTAFELSPTGGQWTEKMLHDFGQGMDGAYPFSNLIFDAEENLYGTTYQGGSNGYGTVFELQTSGQETVLHNFNANGSDGAYSYAGLIFDADGNLYGSTFGGGSDIGYGTVFELTPAGGEDWTETVLRDFLDNGKDGTLPHAGLIFDAAGNLYGTTRDGGVHNAGTVFELMPEEGGGWTEKILHNFSTTGTGGQQPYCALVFDKNGNLYGTTYGGGAIGYGTVFELIHKKGGTWSEKVLHSFGKGSDGARPYASLVMDAAGNLYGTTWMGGANGGGTVFEIIP